MTNRVVRSVERLQTVPGCPGIMIDITGNSYDVSYVLALCCDKQSNGSPP